MSVVDAVREARNAQEAMLALADAVERIEVMLREFTPDSVSGEWESWEASAEPEGIKTETGADGENVVVLPTPSAKQYNARLTLAKEHMHLDEAFPKVDFDPIEVYAKGGPSWLYIYDRDLVLGMRDSIKRELVRDLMADDPEAASDMARDILKDTHANPPHLDV